MWRVITLVFAPLLSLFILILGNGLLTTLLTVKLHIAGASSWAAGAVVAAYYGGLVIGSFRIEPFIVRVGHIRAYAGFASIMAVIAMLQGLFEVPWVWILLRFVGGYCMAGLFIVIESWMVARSGPKTRGQALSLYMIAQYAAQALGQFLLNVSSIDTVIPFCIVTILASLSVVPLAMTYISSPQFEEPSALSFAKLYKLSPSGVIGCFCSGLILGAVYGLMPLAIGQLQYPISDVALFMGILIFGGMALQWPIGKISDVYNRRNVLIYISLFLLLTNVVIIAVSQEFRYVFITLLFLLGGFSFTLYPLSVSHACDYVEGKDIVAATQGLLLAYGIGATAGPLLAPSLIHYYQHFGLFIYFSAIAGFLALFFGWRRTRKSRISVEEQQDFVSVPRTTPVAQELDPRAEE